MEKISLQELSNRRDEFILVDTPTLWKEATHYFYVDDKENPYKSYVYYLISKEKLQAKFKYRKRTVVQNVWSF